MGLNDIMEINDKRYGVDIISMINTNALTKFKIEDGNYEELTIENALANRYIGDFYGLLIELNIPKELSYIIMILNGLRSNIEYTGFRTIKIPDRNIINDLYKSNTSDLTVPQIK